MSMCVCVGVFHRLAREMCVRVQKERDYHRMHHRRVLQEKESISSELKL